MNVKAMKTLEEIVAALYYKLRELDLPSDIAVHITAFHDGTITSTWAGNEQIVTGASNMQWREGVLLEAQIQEHNRNKKIRDDSKG